MSSLAPYDPRQEIEILNEKRQVLEAKNEIIRHKEIPELDAELKSLTKQQRSAWFPSSFQGEIDEVNDRLSRARQQIHENNELIISISKNIITHTTKIKMFNHSSFDKRWISVGISASMYFSLFLFWWFPVYFLRRHTKRPYTQQQIELRQLAFGREFPKRLAHEPHRVAKRICLISLACWLIEKWWENCL
jgi:hypothetical protein